MRRTGSLRQEIVISLSDMIAQSMKLLRPTHPSPGPASGTPRANNPLSQLAALMGRKRRQGWVIRRVAGGYVDFYQGHGGERVWGPLETARVYTSLELAQAAQKRLQQGFKYAVLSVQNV